MKSSATGSRGCWSAISTPPTTTTTAPNSGAGVHLLRDIHDLRGLYPDDGRLAQWAEAVHGLYAEAKAFAHPKGSGAPHNRPGNSASWPSAVPSWMTARQPRPSCAVASSATSRNSSSSGRTGGASDNNAAEAACHLVVSRKVSGGTCLAGPSLRCSSLLNSEQFAQPPLIPPRPPTGANRRSQR